MNTYIYNEPSDAGAPPVNRASSSCSAHQPKNTLLAVAAAERRKILEYRINDALPLLHELGGLPRTDNSRHRQPTMWPHTDPLAASFSHSGTSYLPFSVSASRNCSGAPALLPAEIQRLKSAYSRHDESCPSTLASLPSIHPAGYPLSALLLPHQRISFSSSRAGASHLMGTSPHANHQPLLNDGGSSLFGGTLVNQRRLPGKPTLSDQYHHHHHVSSAGRFFDDNVLLPLTHFVGTPAGESKGDTWTTPPSILQYATSRSAMLTSNAASMNTTTLLGQRRILAAEELHYYNTKTKRPSLFFMNEQRGIFPVILHQALMELERVGDMSTAAFLPDGKSFAIRNQHLFENRVLRVFFPKMKGFASFQRQLNLYDFIRIGGTGPDRGSYHHELFHRDSPSKAAEMKRTKIKGGSKCRRRASSSTSEASDAPTNHTTCTSSTSTTAGDGE